MTTDRPAERRHTWQKLNTTEMSDDFRALQWVEVCLHCYVERRMLKWPSGHLEVMHTRPRPLPEQCMPNTAIVKNEPGATP